MKNLFLTIAALLITTTFVYSQCQANFTYTVQGTTVIFTNTSTGGQGIYSWNFGDGSTSSQQNPTHTYLLSGNYTVCLSITILPIPPNPPCQDTHCDTVIVTSCGNCIASFTSSPDSLSTLKINFFGTVTGGSSPTWAWNFGDGTSSTQQNPSHTYSQAGTYFVCLSILAVNGTTICQDTCCDSVIVTGSVNNCTASFTSSPDSLNPLKINFSGIATGGSSPSWAWSFGDGNSSTQQNPSHTYSLSGTYYVCLAINVITSGSTCHDTYCDSVTVSSGALTCQAGFTYTSTGSIFNFTDTSSNYSGNSWHWSLGDGNTSLLQNPTHTYSTNGVYNVCLTIADSSCLDSTCKTISVTTSIEQLNNNNFTIGNIFPNPVTDNLNIEIFISKPKLIELLIYNLYGQLIKSVFINKETGINIISINTNAMNNGVYFIKISQEDGIIVLRKFIKI